MKGIYGLEIFLKQDSHIKIGALGTVDFEKGLYYYIGSAQNNLEKRIERHKKPKTKLHWHIDYLLNDENANLERVFCKVADKTEECRVAEQISAKNKSMKGFGCTDCSCRSHLFMGNSEKILIANGMQVIPD